MQTRYDRLVLWERKVRLAAPATASTDLLANLMNYCEGLDVFLAKAIHEYFASQPRMFYAASAMELTIWRTGQPQTPSRFKSVKYRKVPDVPKRRPARSRNARD